MKKIPFALIVVFLILMTGLACSSQENQVATPKAMVDVPTRDAAQKFLDQFSTKFQSLYYQTSQAEWLAGTDISDEHDKALITAETQMSRYVGSKGIIDTTRYLMSKKNELTNAQTRQLDSIWYLASHYPYSAQKLVDELIQAEAKQSSDLFSFEFHTSTNGKDTVLTPNDIDTTLQKSTDLNQRRKVWEVSKEVGKALKDGLVNLQRLRNGVARAMGHSSFFGLEVMPYGMTSKEMVDLMDKVLEELKPLYTELHTFARYELAKKFNQPVPEFLPAHWVGNRWGQNWPGLVEAADLDPLLKNKSREWIITQAENFYTSMDFPKLPAVFWEKSDLYPVDKNSPRKKNTHASAWHLDLDKDIRSLMSVEPNMQWFTTTHHELGHAYYYIAYSRPEVPILLREGANRAFHEGVGTLIGLAAGQQPYLKQIGILPANSNIDKTAWLLDQALEHIVFMPFGAGTMTRFEYDLYEKNLPKSEFNKRWWDLVKKYQGIVPPDHRGEEYTDAATKTHINDDPGQYYDYAMSELILFQLHEHICDKILKQHPSECNYYGNKEVGAYLQNLLKLGATRDWREVLKEVTGSDLSAKAMLRYFEPLTEHLKKVNAGRKPAVL